MLRFLVGILLLVYLRRLIICEFIDRSIDKVSHDFVCMPIDLFFLYCTFDVSSIRGWASLRWIPWLFSIIMGYFATSLRLRKASNIRNHQTPGKYYLEMVACFDMRVVLSLANKYAIH